MNQDLFTPNIHDLEVLIHQTKSPSSDNMQPICRGCGLASSGPILDVQVSCKTWKIDLKAYFVLNAEREREGFPKHGSAKLMSEF